MYVLVHQCVCVCVSMYVLVHKCMCMYINVYVLVYINVYVLVYINVYVHHCMLVQVYDLQYASPATISRCGMVYVDPKNLGYMPFWEKWINDRPANEQKDLMGFFEKYVRPGIDYIIEGIHDGHEGEKLKTIVPLTNLNLVSSMAIK